MVLKDGREIMIRQAVKDDAQAILLYLKKVGSQSDNLLFGAEGVPMSLDEEKQFLQRMSTLKTSVMLLAMVGNDIAGIGSLQSSSRERIAHQADVALSVEKSFWHVGVGTFLIASLIQFARQTGQTEILHLGVRADNVRAIALYRRMGFARIGLYPRFFKVRGEYFDEVLMNLNLSAPNREHDACTPF